MTSSSPNRPGAGRVASDQALAVPVEPVARLDPTGFDPSRLEHLADECETVTWADPALARQIGEAAKSFQVRSDWNPLAWLDEAITLVPEGWHITHSGEGRFLTRGRFAVTLETWSVEYAADGEVIHTTPDRRHGVAQMFASALTAAALRAIATEARRAETAKSDPVHEGADPKGIAQGSRP
jgi:hypothetical protein